MIKSAAIVGALAAAVVMPADAQSRSARGGSSGNRPSVTRTASPTMTGPAISFSPYTHHNRPQTSHATQPSGPGRMLNRGPTHGTPTDGGERRDHRRGDTRHVDDRQDHRIPDQNVVEINNRISYISANIWGGLGGYGYPGRYVIPVGGCFDYAYCGSARENVRESEYIERVEQSNYALSEEKRELEERVHELEIEKARRDERDKVLKEMGVDGCIKDCLKERSYREERKQERREHEQYERRMEKYKKLQEENVVHHRVRYAGDAVPCDLQFDDMAIDFFNDYFDEAGTGHVAYDLGNNVVGVRDADNNMVRRIRVSDYFGMNSREYVGWLKIEGKIVTGKDLDVKATFVPYTPDSCQ